MCYYTFFLWNFGIFAQIKSQNWDRRQEAHQNGKPLAENKPFAKIFSDANGIFSQIFKKKGRMATYVIFFSTKNRPKSTTFWCDKIKMRFFLWIFFVAGYWRKNFFRRNFCAPELEMGTIFRPDAPKIGVFWGKIVLFPLEGPPATRFSSATLWGSSCLKTTLVVSVAKNCWFHQKLKKNRHHKWKFGASGRKIVPIDLRREKFRRKNFFLQ